MIIGKLIEIMTLLKEYWKTKPSIYIYKVYIYNILQVFIDGLGE